MSLTGFDVTGYGFSLRRLAGHCGVAVSSTLIQAAEWSPLIKVVYPALIQILCVGALMTFSHVDLRGLPVELSRE